jgi:hypothetical protein
MTATRREMQRIVDAVTMACLDGVDEAEIQRLVRLGLDAAGRIQAARVPIDWDALPTIGSPATI